MDFKCRRICLILNIIILPIGTRTTRTRGSIRSQTKREQKMKAKELELRLREESLDDVLQSIDDKEIAELLADYWYTEQWSGYEKVTEALRRLGYSEKKINAFVGRTINRRCHSLGGRGEPDREMDEMIEKELGLDQLTDKDLEEAKSLFAGMSDDDMSIKEIEELFS